MNIFERIAMLKERHRRKHSNQKNIDSIRKCEENQECKGVLEIDITVKSTVLAIPEPIMAEFFYSDSAGMLLGDKEDEEEEE